jgi:hypothetical protein
VLDEPTVGLDPIARTDVWEYIAKLRAAHRMTVLMTTHYMDEADAYCDRIALMHRGAIRATGTPAALKATLGDGASLDDVFRHYTGDTLDQDSEKGGIRDVRRVQAAAVVVLAAVLGVALTGNPLRLIATAAVVVLGAAFFSCLSMTIAGLALSRDRLMGIGQAITMPLFFSSNVLYPTGLMPGWLQAISKVNPLSYEVDALRGLLIGTPAHLPLDAAVLILATILGITAASLLLPRLAR